MNINFFTWIREGVKHSVLLGVGDAIETLGTPETNESDRDALLAFLKSEDSEGKASGRRIAAKSTKRTTANSRKRLGKSLKDIEPAEQK